jgi:hypothetical protein
MSVTASTRSAQRRGLTRACVAALALLLSALGGIRIGIDRLIGTSDENPIVCAIAPACPDQKRAASPEAVATCQATVSLSLLPMAGSTALYAQTTVNAPSLLQGSAGGPRAP